MFSVGGAPGVSLQFVTQSSPLVSSVLIPTEASSQVERAVRRQAGVHPLGEMEDLGRREGFPLTLLSLQPTLAATGRALLSASEDESTESENTRRPDVIAGSNCRGLYSGLFVASTCSVPLFWLCPGWIVPAGSR